MRALKVLCAGGVAAMLLSGCGYNTMQVQDEAVKSAWSEVVNQYQRRADLIPNLVNTVKGFAAQEQAVLIGVTEARAKATQVTVDADDPQSLQQFQAAQGELSSALSRLMVVVERYPELKSDQNFRDLQAQLEGTENRITVARNRYIQAVQDYQRHGAEVPGQPDGDGLRIQRQAELRGRERGGDRAAADGGLRTAPAGTATRRPTRLRLRARAAAAPDQLSPPRAAPARGAG